jgi:hypothetical protein
MQATTSSKTQLDEFELNIEKDFSQVSCLSTGIAMRSAWYLNNVASCHMTEAQEIFKI